MSTTVKVVSTQRVTVKPDVTETVTVRIKAVGPQGPDGISTGDMTKAVYDPTTVEGDAFDMDNMAEGVSLILTAAERNLITQIGSKEQAGVAASLDAQHLIDFAHALIDHANRASLDLVSGTNTGDQDLSGKENVGVAAGLDAQHLIDFTHSLIAHTNRVALDLVSGTNTGDQDLSGKEAVGVAAGLDAQHLIDFAHGLIAFFTINHGPVSFLLEDLTYKVNY